MKKILFVTIVSFFLGCAGSILSPNMTDYYGNKVDLIKKGAILKSIDRDTIEPDIFYLRFWENDHPVWSQGNSIIEKQKSLRTYMKKVGDDNGYIGFMVVSETLPVGYYNTHIYVVRYVKSQEEWDLWNQRYKD